MIIHKLIFQTCFYSGNTLWNFRKEGKEKRIRQSIISKYICAGKEYNERCGKLLNNRCGKVVVKESN
jgi:hypothetical protein